jgi:histidinol-phosphatase (PHP family)
MSSGSAQKVQPASITVRALQGFGDFGKDPGKGNLAVELNTSGFHYPVKEAFPSPDLLRRCAQLQIPLVTGSDAHTPEVGGQGFRSGPGPAESRRLPALTGFFHRQREIVPL